MKNRPRKGLIPADEHAWDLVEQLIRSKQFSIKQAVRVVQKRGYEVRGSTAYIKMSERKLPVKKPPKKNSAKERESERKKLKNAISTFKRSDTGQQLALLDKIIAVRDELKEKSNTALSETARKSIAAKVRHFNSLLKLFGKYVEKKEALKERRV